MRHLAEKFVIATGLVVLVAPAGAQTSDDFFNDSALQDLKVTMSPADWNHIKQNIYDQTYFPCDFQWSGGAIKNIGIKQHGHGSPSSVKPNLKLKMDEFVKGQMLVGLTEVDLKNNVQDMSAMHDRLAMKIFTHLGAPAPRTASARLYVNGEYVGLYTNFESVDAEYVLHWLGENAGYLYSYEQGDWAGVPGGQWHWEWLGPDLTKYAITPPDNKPAPFNPQTHSGAPDTVSLELLARRFAQHPPDRARFWMDSARGGLPVIPSLHCSGC